MIVYDQRVALFVERGVGIRLTPPYVLLGIEKDDEITAGVVFNCFEGADIHVTAAGTGWTRGFLEAVGDYVFNQLGCRRMTFVTSQRRVCRLAEKLGARWEGVMREHFGEGVDGYIYGVLKDEYKFLGGKK